MNDADKKLLTEYLGECWHEWEYYSPCRLCSNDSDEQCLRCKAWKSEVGNNRTFTTEADMMALYRAMWKVVGMQSWFRFYDEAMDIYEATHNPCECITDTGDFVAWLFCLSGEGYEARCQMVADWIKEASHERSHNSAE